MYAFDVLAALALAGGALVGAKRGLWKMTAGGTAVVLGAASAWATSDVLAAALRDWGVGPPGDAILGFFLPFALVSVYARFIIGLWLSKRLEKAPERNRFLGAAAGVACVVFAAGLAARAAGVGPQAVCARGDVDRPPEAAAPACRADGSADGSLAGTRLSVDAASGPFTRWLARYPGGVGAWAYALAGRGEDDRRRLTGTLKGALDNTHAQKRASRADEEAFGSPRDEHSVPLRVETVPEEW